MKLFLWNYHACKCKTALSWTFQPPATGSTLQPPHLFGPGIRNITEFFSETPSAFQLRDAYFRDYTTGLKFLMFFLHQKSGNTVFFAMVATVSLLSANVSQPQQLLHMWISAPLVAR